MILEKKYRFDNLEFRWVEAVRWVKTDGPDQNLRYPEIVCWVKKIDNSEFCYTLAYWDEDSEGWDLKFVGDRPFDYDNVDPKLFWELARMGNTVANADWRMQRFMRER